MNPNPNRRGFLKKSAATALALPLIASLEEFALAEQTKTASPAPGAPEPKAAVPFGTIGKVKLSRLICGGNLINGYAHSRDLIYVSSLLKHYFNEAKIMETWALCEQHGINTMIHHPANPEAAALPAQSARSCWETSAIPGPAKAM